MDIIEVNHSDKRQIKQFLDLPFRLYSDVSAWVPPLEPDAKLILNRVNTLSIRMEERSFFWPLRKTNL